MKLSRLIPAAVAAASLLVASTASAEVLPGTYMAKAPGVSATVTVTESNSTLRYSLKTVCGKTRGKMALTRAGAGLAGKRLSRGPHSSLRITKTTMTSSPSGTELKGKVRDSISGGKQGSCRGKRAFTAALDGAGEAFVPLRDAGHYTGTDDLGLPIVFDVFYDPFAGETSISNLSVDVESECVREGLLGDETFQMVTHITDLGGKVKNDGTFYIVHAPDDETEHEVDGRLTGDTSKVDVWISGRFNEDGTMNPAGPLYCDNFGAIYKASRVG